MPHQIYVIHCQTLDIEMKLNHKNGTSKRRLNCNWRVQFNNVLIDSIFLWIAHSFVSVSTSQWCDWTAENLFSNVFALWNDAIYKVSIAFSKLEHCSLGTKNAQFFCWNFSKTIVISHRPKTTSISANNPWIELIVTFYRCQQNQ